MTINTSMKAPEQIAREYENAVDPELVEFIKKVRSISGNGANKLEYVVSPIGEKQRDDYEKLLGVPLNATYNVYGGSEVNHTVNRHGKDGEADHSMANINDMARIGYIINNYDQIGFAKKNTGKTSYSRIFKTPDNKPAPILLYVKRINGFYVIAEAANDSKNLKLNIISTYKCTRNPLII